MCMYYLELICAHISTCFPSTAELERLISNFISLDTFYKKYEFFEFSSFFPSCFRVFYSISKVIESIEMEMNPSLCNVWELLWLWAAYTAVGNKFSFFDVSTLLFVILSTLYNMNWIWKKKYSRDEDYSKNKPYNSEILETIFPWI